MSINSQQLIASFSEFGSAKNIDKPTLIRMLNDVLQNLIEKKYGTYQNFDIVINPTKGDVQIWRYREIVSDDSEKINENNKISLSDAQKIEPDFEVGEEVAEEISLDTFSRRAIKQAFSLLTKKVEDIKTNKTYEKCKKLEGEIITTEVYYKRKKDTILYDDLRNECILPHEESIPGENYKKGENLRVVIKKVLIYKNKVAIIVSRASSKFVEGLLTQEIPEIRDGLVEIKNVVRQPGIKTKVAVTSDYDSINPVTACLGLKSMRLHNIMREINQEQIDIIEYTNKPETYLIRSLGLKQDEVIKVHDIDEDTILIDLKPDRVATTIGSKGHNVNLASQLIGKKIKINDIPIEEFADKLPKTTLETLKLQQLNTAKTLLALPTEILIEKTQLDETTIEAIQNLLQEAVQEKNTTNLS